MTEFNPGNDPVQERIADASKDPLLVDLCDDNFMHGHRREARYDEDETIKIISARYGLDEYQAREAKEICDQDILIGITRLPINPMEISVEQAKEYASRDPLITKALEWSYSQNGTPLDEDQKLELGRKICKKWMLDLEVFSDVWDNADVLYKIKIRGDFDVEQEIKNILDWSASQRAALDVQTDSPHDIYSVADFIERAARPYITGQDNEDELIMNIYQEVAKVLPGIKYEDVKVMIKSLTSVAEADAEYDERDRQDD